MFRSGLPFMMAASLLAALTRPELDAIGKSLDEKLDRVIANLDRRVKA